jgi:hypothetical protein
MSRKPSGAIFLPPLAARPAFLYDSSQQPLVAQRATLAQPSSSHLPALSERPYRPQTACPAPARAPRQEVAASVEVARPVSAKSFFMPPPSTPLLISKTPSLYPSTLELPIPAPTGLFPKIGSFTSSIAPASRKILEENPTESPFVGRSLFSSRVVEENPIASPFAGRSLFSPSVVEEHPLVSPSADRSLFSPRGVKANPTESRGIFSAPAQASASSFLPGIKR